VHGGFVSAGAVVEVELEAAKDAFGLLFFGGGSDAIADVMRRQVGRKNCMKRIIGRKCNGGRDYVAQEVSLQGSGWCDCGGPLE